MGNKYKRARKYFDIRDFSASEIQEITGVDATTARRYRRTGKAPEPVWRLLAYTAAGFLIPDGFAHVMHFHGEHLQLDTGETFSVELLAWHWNRQALQDELRNLQNRIRRLQAKHIIEGRKNRQFGAPRLLDKPTHQSRPEEANHAPDQGRPDWVKWRRLAD